MATTTRQAHRLRFAVVLEPDEAEGGFAVTVPALPGCVSEGDTREDALRDVQEAITGYLEALAKAGHPLPTGDEAEAAVVTVPAPA